MNFLYQRVTSKLSLVCMQYIQELSTKLYVCWIRKLNVAYINLRLFMLLFEHFQRRTVIWEQLDWCKMRLLHSIAFCWCNFPHIVLFKLHESKISKLWYISNYLRYKIYNLYKIIYPFFDFIISLIVISGLFPANLWYNLMHNSF